MNVMKMIRCSFLGSARIWGQFLLGLLLAGCGSLHSDDPVNPKRPYAFPGEAPAAPAVASTQPGPAPKIPAQPASTAPAVPVAVMPVIAGTASPLPVTAPTPSAAAPVTPAIPAPTSSANTSSGLNVQGTLSVLRPGDIIVVSFSELPATAPLIPVTSELGEEGKITLPHNISVHALGKTPRQLEQEIRGEYVPKFYRYLTVTVRPEMRYFHVNGEVKLPAMYAWKGEPTVLRAVGAAGGFTDWARRWQVQLIRSNGQKFTVDCKKAEKDPSKDLLVFPGDYINVPRKNALGF